MHITNTTQRSINIYKYYLVQVHGDSNEPLFRGSAIPRVSCRVSASLGISEYAGMAGPNHGDKMKKIT